MGDRLAAAHRLTDHQAEGAAAITAALHTAGQVALDVFVVAGADHQAIAAAAVANHLTHPP